MNRSKQMWVLLLLTSATLAPVYWMLGWQSGGHGPASVPPVFWSIEAWAWSVRAIVEAWALVYLFQTEPQSRLLAGFEVALVALIGFTVGLVIVANGGGQSIASAQAGPLFWLWAFSVATFAPLMLGSVGYAYRLGLGGFRQADNEQDIARPVGQADIDTDIARNVRQTEDNGQDIAQPVRQPQATGTDIAQPVGQNRDKRQTSKKSSKARRHQRLLKLVNETGVTDKNELARTFSVTPKTIERDMSELDGQLKGPVR